MAADRIVLLGAGIAGVAAAYGLGRAGAKQVLLLERESRPGRHATAQNAGILRTAIAAPPTRALGRETLTFLADPPVGFASDNLFVRRGLLILPPGPAEAPAPAWAPSALDRGDARELNRAQCQALAPWFHSEAQRGYHFPHEGTVDVPQLVDAFTRGAIDSGVRIRTEAHVRDLVQDGDTIRGVRLSCGERIDADTVVLAGGGWAGDLGRAAGSRVRLNPTRRHALRTVADPRIQPKWPVVWDDGAGFYARPDAGGWLLSACDQEPVDPDHLQTAPRALRRIAEQRRVHLPDFAEAATRHLWAGIRTLTPDDVPAIGPDPDLRGLFWCAGLGGHGITTSAAVGRLAADLLLERGPDPALAHAGRPPAPVSVGEPEPSASDWPTAVRLLDAALTRTFDELESWCAWNANDADRRPAPDAWSVHEILEHLVLMHRFVLILVDKIAAKCARRLAEGQAVPTEPSPLAHLRALAQREHTWPHPEHMTPSGTLGRAEVHDALRTDRARIRALLERHPDGAGALHKIRLSAVPGADDRLDLYQFLAVIELHAGRHLQQLERTAAALGTDPPHARHGETPGAHGSPGADRPDSHSG